MKKLLILFLMFSLLPVFSQEIDPDMEIVENLGVLTKKSSKIQSLSPHQEIRNLFKLQEKYTNEQNVDGLKSLYADKYISCDGFNKDIYLNLAEKTWKTYKNLKYKSYVKNILLTGKDQATVEVEEYIDGLSLVQNKYINEAYGLLENVSKSIYILKKINGKWQVVSDNIYFEHTFLTFGSAKFIPSCLVSPEQVNAGTNYEVSLFVDVPKNKLAVGSIGKENITYPQISAEEVFRKISDSNVLERIVKANSKNLNEYAVAFYVIMDTNNSEDIEKLKMKVSGVGLAMNRVNVVPKNKYIKVEDEKIGQEH
ncbi:hypothetical protein IJ732_05985 [bacterium]|nr:hypothetical protein [bacterium]